MSDHGTSQTRLISSDEADTSAPDQELDTPTALVDDLPTVQLPLGRDRPGLTIDGEFYTLFELPDDAVDAYRAYAEQGGSVRVWQCDRCGYLTDADALSVTSHATYECGNCGASTGSTQRRASGSFTQVYGPTVDVDDDRFVDVEAVIPEASCSADHGPVIPDDSPDLRAASYSVETDDAARSCPDCVPNHPSHLGRLQNTVGGSITMDEMLHEVAVAVQSFREA